MQTEHILITDPTEQATDIRRAACIIRTGGLVVFPTETVYGLGGDATNADASRRIYAAKGRPSDNPLIIHVASPQDAAMYADTDALYDRLAKAFMPGPLTVIMPRKPIIPLSTTGGLETVAVRCPSHPVAHALIAAAGVPIAAPSANLSGKPSPTCAAHVAQDMDGRVDMILDGGDCEIGLESTIVKLDRDGDGEFLTLLRPGHITLEDLERALGEEVELSKAILEKLPEGAVVRSPGMKYKHYAPATPVVLLEGTPEHVLSYLQERQKTERCAILCYDEEIPHLLPGGLLPVGARDDLATHAHTLFARLRESDSLHADVVYAHLPPREGLGLALYNRMIRAAAHTVRKV